MGASQGQQAAVPADRTRGVHKGFAAGQHYTTLYTSLDNTQGGAHTRSQDVAPGKRYTRFRPGSNTLHYTVHYTHKAAHVAPGKRHWQAREASGRQLPKVAACCQHNSSRQGPGAQRPYHARGREAGRGFVVVMVGLSVVFFLGGG